MEFLQTAWVYVLNSWQILKDWVADPVNEPTINTVSLFAAFLAILGFFWAILKFITKPYRKKKPNPETSPSSSAALDFAKAIIAANEQGKQTAEASLQQRDQQIEALTKAVEALQTERREAETKTEQTTIDTALAHLKEGNPSEAEAIFEEILEEQSKRGQEANQQAAAAARHIGALAFLHNTDKAHIAYKRATELAPDNADDWNMLGHLQNRLGQLDNAITSYKKVLALGKSSADQILIAIALSNLGNIYQTRGELEKAEKAHLKSLKIDKLLDNRKGIAASYGNLGIIYQIQGNLQKAENSQLKALQTNNELNNTPGIAENYTNLGVIYQILGDLEKAEQTQSKALKINIELNKIGSIANNYTNLGNIYLLRNNPKKAEDTHLKALKINIRLGNKQGIATNYGNLGIVYKNLGELEKAEDAQLNSLAIEKQLGNKEGIAACYGNLGIIYQIQGNLDKSEVIQLKSLELKKLLGNKHGMANSYTNLGVINELIGNRSTACKNWIKALNLYTEIEAKPEIERTLELLREAKCHITN